MINPGGIPRIPGDMDVLAQHARALSRVGPDFAATGEQVHSTWQQLAGVYEAPEVSQLLAATGPVKSLSASVGEDIAAVGRALSTYAATVKQIQERLDALRVQARELVAEAQADKDSEGTLEKVGEFVGIGGDDDEYAERSNQLAGQVNAQVAAFAEAQRRCANTINALYGGIQYRADDGDGKQERGEFGFTREQLDMALEQGVELPWGSQAETDTGIVGGVWDGAKMFVGDLGALIGRDPTTGEWSWSTAGTAWKGLGTFALAIGVYSMPGGVGAVLDQTVGVPGFERGQMGETLLAAGKGLIAYDEWGKGDNARAGGMAGFNILSAVVGTKGAGAALRGVGAGAQASRLGLVSRAGTAMVRGGEFIGRLPTTTDMVKGLANKFPSLHIPNLSGTAHVNVPHHVDTPPVHTGSPHVHAPDGPHVRTPDTPDVHTPHPDTPTTPTTPRPGSVGDALSHSGRPDAPASTPPAHARHPDAPAPHQPDAPGGHTPHDNGPSGAQPHDHTPGDRTPGDDTPGDHAPGDHTPGDHGGTTGDAHQGAGSEGAPHDRSDSGHAPDDGRVGEHRADTDHMPAPAPGSHSLETLAESRVERGADGLIETVDGRPVHEHLRDVAEQRAEQYRDGRSNGEFSRGDIGEVSSVAFDRQTGELFESTNGRSRDGIALDDLHPLLRERLERLEADGPYTPGDAPGSAGSSSWPYPHPDNPLSHAEVRAVNELLWRRGANVGPEVFRSLRVDNHFPFNAGGVRSAPCCANCSSLLAGTPSNAGRFTGFPPGPENLLPE